MTLSYFYPAKDRPILDQLPTPFKHAAIILSPFISMPKSVSDRPILRFQHGVPIDWGTVQQLYGYHSYKQVGQLIVDDFLSNDQAGKMDEVKRDLLLPQPGRVSEKLIVSLSSLLCSKNADKISYVYQGEDVQEMIVDECKMFGSTLTALCSGPITIQDENRDFMITSGGNDPFCLVFNREPFDVFWPCDYWLADRTTKAKLKDETQVVPAEDYWYYPGFSLPVLDQAPPPFKSAVYILSPFIQMSSLIEGYDNRPFTAKEFQTYGTPVKWETVRRLCGFDSIEELDQALALMIGLGNKEEEYLYDQLKSQLKDGLFPPNEDNFSELLIPDILKLMASKGAKTANLTNLTGNKKPAISLTHPSEEELEWLCEGPTTLIDENRDFMLTCFFDSFCSILYSRDDSIKELLEPFDWETIICDEKTKYWRQLHQRKKGKN